MRALAAAVLTAVLAQGPTPEVRPRCVPDADTSSWIAEAFAGWDRVRRDALGLGDASPPWVVFFDATCTFQVRPGEASVDGAPHAGQVGLPDGKTIPATLTTFAATYGADERPFMVMALPEIWRREPRHQSDPNLDLLIRSVFVHEMTHTRQAQSTGLWLKSLEERQQLPEDLSDDIVQQRFADRPGFTESYERERDLLFAAAEAVDRGERRALAKQAVDAMRARRARYFNGADAIYADLEDLFLNMEGVANWAAFRLAGEELGSRAEAVSFIRRGGRFWSQDEGLALFLALDALTPSWQPQLFGATPVPIIDLLGKAASSN